MKKETYTFWLPLIVGGIALLSGFVVWSVNVYRVTYLTIRGEQYLAGGALLLALVPMVIFIRKGRLKGKRVAGAIKLYLGFFICSLPVAMFVIFTTAWLLEGDYSSWSKPYRYESSTRHSCSGAEVYEPELKKEIRICNPKGNVYSNSTLYVEKRSNALGIVVLWAITRT
ncbi:hypothetical protein KKZ87_15000 [Enterobacter cloacae]|uniref:hypothetical protein n=1 Tax=Enterobacter cloacae TaxID=550 RepID=UPI001BDF1CE6|nr:hypothetical protein [Enterobacter cloacae]MBT1836127.1 hypothetical protein [Enterobacter cloacae]HBL5000798.1 hypothetical protein [Enterobacter cloacae]